MLFDQGEMAAGWVEYIAGLYEDHRGRMPGFGGHGGRRSAESIKISKRWKSNRYG